MNKLLRGLIVSIPLMAPAALRAQEPAAPEKPIAEPEATVAAEEDAGPNTGAMSFAAGLDWTTAYFFRGYNQEDTGLILQPYATIYADILDNDDVGVTAYVGIWNSFHSKKTGAGSSPNSWYESDLFGGVDVSCGAFTIGAIYTYYTYPNDAFETIQEIGGKVTFDDSTVWGDDAPVVLSPYIAAYRETSDGNGTEDTYGEIGVNPGFDLGVCDITLSVPVALGLSLDDYYVDPGDGDNELLGYASVGAMASLPLPMPSDYGAWSLVAGVQYIHLFADGLEAVNDGGEDYELIGKLGVSVSY